MAGPSQKSLTASSLIKAVYEKFLKIPDPRSFERKSKIALIDHLMAGLAIFGLKFPSLLQFDRKRKDSETEGNLKKLYHIHTPPSDTYLAERLDVVDPSYLRPAFKKLFAKLQRSKKLENFEFFDAHYLLSLDGTGQFSSGNVSYSHCCKKEHRNGKVTYYHQMLGGCIVHPEQSEDIVNDFTGDVYDRNAIYHLFSHLGYQNDHTYSDPTVFANENEQNEFVTEFTRYFNRRYAPLVLANILLTQIRENDVKWAQIVPVLEMLNYQESGNKLISNFEDMVGEGATPIYTQFAMLEILRVFNVLKRND